MATPKRKIERLWVGVSPQFNAELDHWSMTLGTTKSMLINVCAQAGLKAIIRAIAPEQVFSPDEMASLAVAMEKKGYKPDRTIVEVLAKGKPRATGKSKSRSMPAGR